MPKATAVWLVENTSLTFDQIAKFCGLHPLEVQGIADDEVDVGIVGLDPIGNAQLTREEIERCQGDSTAELKASPPASKIGTSRKGKGPRYTPVSRRQDRPDAISWLLRQHPEVSDAQISKLIGTTKATINAVRDRTHWNSSNLRPRDPVLLGLCTHTEFHTVLERAQKILARKTGTTPPEKVVMPAAIIEPKAPEPKAAPSVDSVFGADEKPAPAPVPDEAPDPADVFRQPE